MRAANLPAAARVLAAADTLIEEAPNRPGMVPAEAAKAAGWTEREVGLLREVTRGGSNKEIARKLFISEAPVHSHVLNIYTKIGVNSRGGAALFAMENDLVHA